MDVGESETQSVSSHCCRIDFLSDFPEVNVSPMTEAHALDFFSMGRFRTLYTVSFRILYTNMAATIRPSCIWRWVQYSSKGPVSFCRCISSDVSRFSKDKSSFENQEDKEWKSVFSYFYSSYNLALNVNSFFNSIDLSPAGLLRSRKNMKESRFHASQAYIPERVRILGGDLAAAHFTTFRKGKVRFCGNPEWICYDEKKEDVNLPRTYTEGYVVEALDLSKMLLTYDGIENLSKLLYLL